MSKIYEALLNAEQEPRELVRPKHVKQEVVRARTATQLPAVIGLNLENEMVMLYQNIEALLPGADRKVLQFISARTGEGTSTVVREFARFAAKKLGKHVMILDPGQHKAKRCVFMRITAECGWQEVTPSGEVLKDVAQKGELDLELFPDSLCMADDVPDFYSPRIADFWESLKQRYDLILIDSPAVSAFPDGIEISRRVDGVLLVVEAEKTRWQVVESLKGKIAGCGGNIIGMVFNKRRYHIPDKVYRLL
ncbi:MAG TPA: CpsD/CapB family tyrosine-protein kinase [Geobacteraceae bacterium]|nr:CpsD/CapB family tyrosine-protein kinase [Geobacteraceae bacterium]